jgi:hypothetical protein
MTGFSGYETQAALTMELLRGGTLDPGNYSREEVEDYHLAKTHNPDDAHHG